MDAALRDMLRDVDEFDAWAACVSRENLAKLFIDKPNSEPIGNWCKFHCIEPVARM
ncbi:MAG TPA: hypothetical protein VEC35_11125 [Noviherbaspirillum sp.]|nr:hypothetical protein [Noviherbaspirillum sp.]